MLARNDAVVCTENHCEVNKVLCNVNWWRDWRTGSADDDRTQTRSMPFELIVHRKHQQHIESRVEEGPSLDDSPNPVDVQDDDWQDFLGVGIEKEIEPSIPTATNRGCVCGGIEFRLEAYNWSCHEKQTIRLHCDYMVCMFELFLAVSIDVVRVSGVL